MTPLSFNRQFFFNKYKPIALKQEVSVFKVKKPLESQNKINDDKNSTDQSQSLDLTNENDFDEKNDQKDTEENNDKIDEQKLLNQEPQKINKIKLKKSLKLSKEEGMKKLNEIIQEFIQKLNQLPIPVEKITITKKQIKKSKLPETLPPKVVNKEEVKQVADLLKEKLGEKQQRELLDFLIK